VHARDWSWEVASHSLYGAGRALYVLSRVPAPVSRQKHANDSVMYDSSDSVYGPDASVHTVDAQKHANAHPVYVSGDSRRGCSDFVQHPGVQKRANHRALQARGTPMQWSTISVHRTTYS